MSCFSGVVATRWLSTREMELLQPFYFTDNNGFVWIARKGDIVDGSSIPRLLWSITGSPFVGKHRKASVLHDVECKRKTKPYKLVHKMYYDACLCAGMNKFKAKLFYLALKVGAPKW